MKHCSVCNQQFDDSISFCPRDGEVLEEDSGSLVGKALDGQYQIEALLGKGGMGAVFLARHILLGDRVAIKVLPPEMRGNTEWLRRFQREGQAARRFRHPNAVTVYDLRTSGDGTIYLVMEYVEGNTLDAELKKRGRFSPAEAVAVLIPVMSVLNAAHAMGVVHRDLKPENIMPLPLHGAVPGVPEAFSRAIARSIAKDRVERQSTAGELESELVAALSAEGIAPSASIADLASEPNLGVSRGMVTAPQQTAATLVTGINEAGPAPAPATMPSQAATMPTVVSPSSEPEVRPSPPPAAVTPAAKPS